MNQLLMKRIAQLKNGEIPTGYKKTEFGIFPCDWETDKTFGDLFDFYGGLGKTREELGEKGHAYLHYGDLHRGAFNVVSHQQYERLPKCDVHLKGNESYLMQDGDVAFLDASEDLEGTSRSVLIDNPENRPFIAGLHIIYGKPKDDCLAKWFKQYITSTESVKKQFQRLAVGFKVYGVNRETLSKIHFAYPKSKEEQAGIAEILMTWDKAIELHKQQIEKLKQFKSVCLKKMFPAKGQTVPEWRFKGFTDAWEQRKLGESLAFLKDGTHGTHADAANGPLLLSAKNIKDGTIKWDESDRRISQDEYEIIHSTFSLKAGDVLLTIVGSIGETAILRDSVGLTFQRSVAFLRPCENISSEFLHTSIQTPRFQKELENRKTTSAQPGIYLGDLAEVPFSFPVQKEEQEQIGECFGRLDNLITLHQRKVETYQKQYRILQQYLLNGIVRV